MPKKPSEFRLLKDWIKSVTTKRAVYYDGTPVVFDSSFPVSDYVGTIIAFTLIQREDLIERHIQGRNKPPNPKWVIYYTHLFTDRVERYFHKDFLVYLNSRHQKYKLKKTTSFCSYCNAMLVYCNKFPCDERVTARMSEDERRERYEQQREAERRKRLAYSFWASFGVERNERRDG